MALLAGTRIGPYEVAAQIGMGGMGEVYRATDTHLKRAVALKVLPTSVAGDADRLARFQREAEVLAALNHPHIAQIYGLERAGETTALVMELVEGPTLAEVISGRAGLQSRQGLPVDEALAIARQIAEALEAAHEQGIIHRDLKPANIKVREDGTVKVLDFGLAKAMEPRTGRAGSEDPAYVPFSQAPTITTPALVTGAGMILGTAAYMAPEQARGKPVDKRADIWAFGCVLYEMLAGKRAFEAEDVSLTLAEVLKAEPDLTALPSTVPGHIRQVVRVCLQKDPRQRGGDIAAVRLALEGAFAGTGFSSQVSAVPRQWRLAVAVASALVVGAAGAGLTTALLREPPPLQVTKLALDDEASDLFFNAVVGSRRVTLTPDGRRVVFLARGGAELAVRDLGDLALRTVSSGGLPRSPFMSPDGRWVGFFDRGVLKKVALGGGTPVAVAPFTGTARGGTWGPDGTIVFATADPSACFG